MGLSGIIYGFFAFEFTCALPPKKLKQKTHKSNKKKASSQQLSNVSVATVYLADMVVPYIACVVDQIIYQIVKYMVQYWTNQEVKFRVGFWCHITGCMAGTMVGLLWKFKVRIKKLSIIINMFSIFTLVCFNFLVQQSLTHIQISIHGTVVVCIIWIEVFVIIALAMIHRCLPPQ